MSKKDQGVPETMPTDEQADAWAVRLSSDQRTQRDDEQFAEWLDRDPGHQARFETSMSLWDELGQLQGSEVARAALGYLYGQSSVLEPEVANDRLPMVTRRRAIWGGLTAAAAAVGAVAFLPAILTSGRSSYSTARGEQRRVTLADGTMVVLDTATMIRVSYSDQQRVITLIGGQAFFDVARDPSRPFRVFAGKDEIRALGTAFEVRYEKGITRVILEEGKVAVFKDGAVAPRVIERTKDRLEARKATVVLAPGQQANLSTANVPDVEPVDLAKTNAWRDGELVFDDVSLETAVAEVNRYGGKPIVLGSPSVAQLRISGTFHTNNPEKFVEGVTAALPVRLGESSDERLVLKKI